MAGTSAAVRENSEDPQKISNGTFPTILLTSDVKHNQANTPSSELHGAVSLFQTNSHRVSSAACSAASGAPETEVAAGEDAQEDFS